VVPLSDDELFKLSIPRGTLSAEEWREIEGHVTRTVQFLPRIPWTHDLQQIPAIAHGHPEKWRVPGIPKDCGIWKFRCPAVFPVTGP
jgi:hypothetical protein